MFRRRSRIDQAKRAVAGRLPSTDEVRDQVAEMTDELGDALEIAKDAIAKAMSSAGRRGAEAGAEATRRTTVLGKEAGRKGVAVGKQTSHRARGAARDAVSRRLPEPDQVAEMTRRATDRMFPERAKQSRKATRKRRRRLILGGTGVAGLGMVIGWLTAPKNGHEARQTLKERANAASDRVAEMRASAGPGMPGGTSTSSERDADTDLGAGPGTTATGTAGSGKSGTTTTGPATATGARGAGAGAGVQSQPAQQNAEVTPIHPGDGATPTKRR